VTFGFVSDGGYLAPKEVVDFTGNILGAPHCRQVSGPFHDNKFAAWDKRLQILHIAQDNERIQLSVNQ
jgi:hypothetical protein